MEPADIFLDANAIIADFNLDGTAFRVLFDGIYRTDSRLLVPQVVIEEVVSKFNAEVAALVDRVGKGIKRYASLTKVAATPPKPDEVRSACEAYRKRLESRLRANDATVLVLPWPNVSHEDLVSRILAGRRPTKTEKGYRDALIWATIMEHVGSSQRRAVLVTQNSHDFAENGALHPDLVEDLRQAGVDPARVALFCSVAELNEAMFLPSLAVLDQIQEDLQAGRYPGVDLAAWFVDNTYELLQDDGLRGVVVDLPHGCGKIRPPLAPDVENIEVTGVRRLGSGDAVANVGAKLSGEVCVSLDGGDYDRFAAAREFLGEYEDRSVDAFMRKEFTITVDVVIGKAGIESGDLRAVDGEYGGYTVGRM